MLRRNKEKDSKEHKYTAPSHTHTQKHTHTQHFMMHHFDSAILSLC